MTMRDKSFLRAGHGQGTGQPHIEVPGDELSQPVPASVAAPAEPLRFREDGTIADRETAKALGRRGGLAKAAKARFVAGLGIAELADDDAFRPFQLAGDDFYRHHATALAAMAGGACGAAPLSMVGSAALQLSASRFLFEQGARTGDPALLKQASQLANDSRQNLLAAYELAVREAKARAQHAPLSVFAPMGDDE